MSIIDFKEIPSGNSSEREQDAFEMFARDFLEALGYTIEEGPSRGPDDGKDLIVIAPLSPNSNDIAQRWLVSCKHYAHSGRAVGNSDDINIRDRIDQFGAEGFMAFYSTLPSSALSRRFSGLRTTKSLNLDVFDKARLERLLLENPRLEGVALRYFPKSYKEKRKQKLRDDLENQLLHIRNDCEGKKQEAMRKNDAVTFLKIQRECEKQMKSATQLCEQKISQLENPDRTILNAD